MFLTSSTLPGKQKPWTGTAFWPSLSSSPLSRNPAKSTCSKGPMAKPTCCAETAVVHMNDVVFFVGSRASTIYRN